MSIAAEKVETAATEADMAAQRDTALDRISSRVFVVWDVDRKRGWLLRGDTVALHVLRVNVGQKYSPEEFDFSALKILKDVADDPSPAYKVLDAFNNQESSLNRIKKGYSEDEDDKEKQLKTSLGAKLDIIYAQLLKLSDESPSLNRHDGNLSGPLRIWFKKKWGTTLRGWDFKRLASFHKPRTFQCRLDKDPGWLKMTRQLEATFLFTKGTGEMLDPLPSSCCCHFPTVPAGKNFLASNMETLGRLITEYGGDDDEGDPPEKTVARLSSNQGWEKGLDPFERKGCKGGHDHLDTVGPSCFPVQSLRDAKYEVNFDKRAGKETKQIHKKELYTKKEIRLMMSKHPKGVVVFGRQPQAEELKALCRRKPTGATTQNAAPTSSAQPAEKPSSQGSTQTQVSAATSPAAVSPAGPGRPSTESAPRASSIDSHRSAASNTQARTSGTTDAPAHPGSSTPRSSAASVCKSASSATLRSIDSATHPRALHGSSNCAGRPQASPAASVQRIASNASQRSIASSTHLNSSEGASSGRAAHPRVSAPGSPANSMQKAVSHASLRSNSSAARAVDQNAGFGRPDEQKLPVPQSVPTATRKPSSSSVRTASSVASRATGDSRSQGPSSKTPDTGLRKTSTNSSERSTGSHSSRIRENLAAFASNRQRQQPFEQAGSTTPAAGGFPSACGQPTNPNEIDRASSAGTTENPAPASGKAPTARNGL